MRSQFFQMIRTFTLLYSSQIIRQSVVRAFHIASNTRFVLNNKHSPKVVTERQRSFLSHHFHRATTPIMSFATATNISYDHPSEDSAVDNYDATVVIGKKKELQKIVKDAALFNSMVGFSTADSIEATLNSISEKSGKATTFISSTHRLSFGTLPDTVCRNNHNMSVHTMTKLVSQTCSYGNAIRLIIYGVSSDSDTDSDTDNNTATPGAAASAIAKAFPLYSKKTSSSDKKKKTVYVCFVNNKGESVNQAQEVCKYVTEGVRLAARLVDMPPEELTTNTYAEMVREIVSKDLPDVSFSELSGDELKDRGYGGLYNVGKGATCPSRLLLLEYAPSSSSTTTTIDETVALVGKGIVYDTGGLSLKTKTGMPGMKHDMGGSAGLLGAFLTYVKLDVAKNKKVVLILCLAENAIGPKAVRNDDIITMYSGKTVEINNSDAEGRLVLGDGVAHATKHIDDLDLVLDMATLTGAQLIATGKKHAGILATSVALEHRVVQAGLRSGDLCFPLLYAPEFLEKEFKSKVADMKNSVKDRGNAQASCAGHFIESHLSKEYKGDWVHIDMAGPGSNDERGTGWGVGLVLSLLKAPGF